MIINFLKDSAFASCCRILDLETGTDVPHPVFYADDEAGYYLSYAREPLRPDQKHQKYAVNIKIQKDEDGREYIPLFRTDRPIKIVHKEDQRQEFPDNRRYLS